MRSFIAMDISKRMRESLVGLISDFDDSGFNVKWARPESMHLTLLFLGDLEPVELDRVRAVLDSLDFARFNLKLKSVGTFVQRGSNVVLWAGLDEVPELMRVADRLRENLKDIEAVNGLNVFVPHITLGRFRNVKRLNELNHRVQRLTIDNGVDSEGDRITLYESRLTPAGSVYTAIFSKVCRC